MKRSPLRAVSKKRRREAITRKRVCLEVLERDGGCVLRGVADHVCAGPLDVHEIVPRSRWAAGWLEPTNCVTACRSLHDWVHAHPNEARSLGLTASRGTE